ncbi:MAG: hypothetical protein KAV87_28710 [Desulfobacteraceae bacterium]|nr:hypothetical protein [Desulfobacteraceae bacterium]
MDGCDTSGSALKSISTNRAVVNAFPITGTGDTNQKTDNPFQICGIPPDVIWGGGSTPVLPAVVKTDFGIVASRVRG